MSKPTVRAAFIAVTTLFFAWGFITSLIDPLVAAVSALMVLGTLGLVLIVERAIGVGKAVSK